LVAASYEDFGLTPVEAASFGKPAAALRWGGFLDTVVEGSTGVFFDEPTPQLIAEAIERMMGTNWDPEVLITHAGQFSTERFTERMQGVVEEESEKL
jgi:glycosyltransferase involved in cell wall biosynthesis